MGRQAKAPQGRGGCAGRRGRAGDDLRDPPLAPQPPPAIPVREKLPRVRLNHPEGGADGRRADPGGLAGDEEAAGRGNSPLTGAAGAAAAAAA